MPYLWESREVQAVFKSMREGVLIVDTEMHIVFANRAYLNFLHCTWEQIAGRPLQEIRPNAQLPDVIRTGKPILHVPRTENLNEIYFVNMYPIWEDGKVAAGLSVVTFLKDACDFRGVLNAYERHNKQVLHRISQLNAAHYTFDSIIAKSPGGKSAMHMAQRAAATEAAVLLASESGTGKELYAQAIHNASPRRQEVFVAINCANFNANMLESELFGYVEGAFTGAKKGGKIGLFEAAKGGTLFLDEISEMDYALQAKLLRVIQEGRYRPVGGVEEIETDVRLISATNADLNAYIEQGKFRQDLFYRLSTFRIRIPPLRERREDIPALAEELLAELSKKLKHPVSLTEGALNCLLAYDWPGNVRELRNVLEFSAYLAENDIITPDSLPEHLSRPQKEEETTLSLAERVHAFEIAEINRCLQKNGTDVAGKRKTARQLGISLATLYNKLIAENSK